RIVSIASLTITLVLACIVMFASPDIANYEANRDVFYQYGFICTLVYFASAYWALRRTQSLNQ
ncbi:MAG: hypothetical protein AAFN10_05100, partial [Bacteroidota bacterium]